MPRVDRQNKQWSREWQSGIRAICASKEAIYFTINDKPLWVIHRFFRVRGTWREWKALQTSLKTRKSLDIRLIVELANYYGFEIQRARYIPKIEES